MAHKRISSSGDELQNQVDAGWVNVRLNSVLLLQLLLPLDLISHTLLQVNLSLMAVTDLIHLSKKLTKGVGGLETLKLECFPK